MVYSIGRDLLVILFCIDNGNARTEGFLSFETIKMCQELGVKGGDGDDLGRPVGLFSFGCLATCFW